MRAAIVACSVAGTLTSVRRPSRDTHRRPREHPAFGQFAHDLLGEERIAGGPLGDRRAQFTDRGSVPSNSATRAAVSASLSGASEMVCAPGTRANAPW